MGREGRGSFLDILLNNGLNRLRVGNGTPEASVAGNVGDVYLRADGGAGTTLYIKESGAGTDTGWVSPGAGGAGTDVSGLDAQRSVAGIAGRGVYSGLVVSEDGGGPSMDVDVTAGHIAFQGAGVLVSADTVTVPTADATFDRIDLVVVDDAGLITVIDGAPAENPVPPTLPDDQVVLAAIAVGAGVTTIEDVDITDKRVRGRWPQVRPCTSNVTKNANTTLIDIPGLNFTVAAGEEWTADVHVSAQSNTTPDLQFDWTFSGTGSFMRFEIFGMNPTTITSLLTQRQFFGGPIAMGGSGLAAGYKMQVTAVGVTVAGVAQAQFAQNTSNASDSTISNKASVLVAYPMVLP